MKKSVRKTELIIFLFSLHLYSLKDIKQLIASIYKLDLLECALKRKEKLERERKIKRKTEKEKERKIGNIKDRPENETKNITKTQTEKRQKAKIHKTRQDKIKPQKC